MRFSRIVIIAMLATRPLAAQTPPDVPCPAPTPTPPERAWKLAVGAGLSLAGGNSDTSSLSLSFSAGWDPKRRDLLKAEGLYLRTAGQGQVTADKTSLALREEHGKGRGFLFGAVGFQRDPIKGVEHLFTPAVGAGYRVVDGPSLLLVADGSVGGAFEQLEGAANTSSLAFAVGQRLEWKASSTVKMFEKASGLWKADDAEDANYHFEVSLVAAAARRLELKLTFIDDFKNKPAAPGLRKNDTTFVAALVFKI